MFNNIPHMYVLFWFRKKPSETNSENPSGFIQVRISYEGKRAELGSTHIECLSSQWDREKQAMAGSSVWARDQNEKLRQIRRKIDDAFRRLELENADINVDLIKERCLNGDVVVQIVKVEVNGKVTEKRLTRRKVYCFADLHGFYLEYQQRLVDRKKIKSSTVRRKKNHLVNIQDFLATIHKDKSPATGLTDTDMENLTDHFMHEKGFKYSYVEKHLRYVVEVMSWSASKGLIRFNPLEKFRISRGCDVPDTTHLPVAELKRLIDFDFNTLVRQKKLTQKKADALARERDAFVFNCFTGMHHVDYRAKKFTIEEKTGEYWLNGAREKTGGGFTIKLLEPAVAIFKKYGSELAELPAIANGGRNDYLHLIAAHCKLSIDLTTKIARKTFADMALNELMLDANDVAALLGLNSTRQLRHYARPRRSRLRQLLSSWDEISSKQA